MLHTTNESSYLLYSGDLGVPYLYIGIIMSFCARVSSVHNHSVEVVDYMLLRPRGIWTDIKVLGVFDFL